MNKPFFSIIIPAYNVEKYICECIFSLKIQTFTDFEIIIVDDGSSDGTANICDNLSLYYTNLQIKVIHQKNQRQIAARMNGFDNSNGEFCIFVDADDKLVPTALEKIKRIIDEYDTDIVIYNGLRVWSDKSVMFWPHYKNTTTYMADQLYDDFKKDALITSRFNNVWNKAFRRSIILDSQRFNNVSFISNGEDYIMQLPWFDRANNATYFPENLYLYRANEESVTSQKFDPYKLKSALYMLKVCKPFYQKWHIKDGDEICRNKFLEWILDATKQLFYKKNEYCFNDKISYLNEIANNDIFRREFSKSNHFLLSKRGILLLWLLYKKQLKLVLFLIEFSHIKKGRH